jgi:hypothetical protein
LSRAIKQLIIKYFHAGILDYTTEREGFGYPSLSATGMVDTYLATQSGKCINR